MSVLFTSISENNPVKRGDAEELVAPFGLTIDPSESADFHTLLAALHDCAESVDAVSGYQPGSDQVTYPRQGIRRPTREGQIFGQAWAHKFLIRGNPNGGVLAGKTLSLKDVIAVAGVPQLMGSDIIPSWTPSSDATVVTRVLHAGADIHGTSTCENYCHSTSSFTSAQGKVENPHARGYSAGGSTSGGAALVAGGVVDLTIGGDQGGSIRVPASFCGCVGLKPTYGRVPYTGVSSGYDGIDDRSVSSPLPGSTSFASALQSSSDSLRGVRMGVLTEGSNHDFISPIVKHSVLAAASKFAKLGATVEQVSLPEHLNGPAIWTVQQRISGAQTLLGLKTISIYQERLDQWTLPHA
ncbi:Uncharacterized protein PECH_003470 [Penicillium ucsense]|uniref:Amidase domain-containing protein n=1 Tax=Penicillium ucsense TaxID=2839758 RepID=A0A8J8VWP0_9EURO|nr:Uncharacterized protein PECM_002950 [Penicillium ucsense]KAF7737554.1 Uncharacterized protein PECH_003470 [Penicillium ucsense]